MHVAIDDTYSSNVHSNSRFVTNNRRTHVAVLIPDEIASEVREAIKGMLEETNNLLGLNINEFHFAEIYNRTGAWSSVDSSANLGLISVFCEFYSHYKFEFIISTIDDRTLKDHGIKLSGNFKEFDFSNRHHQSLFFLLVKIKNKFINNPCQLDILIDEGVGNAKTIPSDGINGSSAIFGNYGDNAICTYLSSNDEPLLQLADFIAFIINRLTILSFKENRTDLDNIFYEMICNMNLNSNDLYIETFPDIRRYADVNLDTFDYVHYQDRAIKKLP
jgi:hypothetical protein